MKKIGVIVYLLTAVLAATTFAAPQQPRDAKAKVPKPPPVSSSTVSMKAGDWFSLFGSCAASKPTQNANGIGWFMSFPADVACSAGTFGVTSLDWLAVNYTSSLATKMTVGFIAQTVVLIGSPVFNFKDIDLNNHGSASPMTRIIFERQNSSNFEDDRWLCHQAYLLDSFVQTAVACQFSGSASFSGQEVVEHLRALRDGSPVSVRRRDLAHADGRAVLRWWQLLLSRREYNQRNGEDRGDGVPSSVA